jgi:hypothetical protein
MLRTLESTQPGNPLWPLLNPVSRAVVSVQAYLEGTHFSSLPEHNIDKALENINHRETCASGDIGSPKVYGAGKHTHICPLDCLDSFHIASCAESTYAYDDKRTRNQDKSKLTH